MWTKRNTIWNLLALALFAGCSYIVPYQGPPGPPVLSDIEFTRVDFDHPRMLKKVFLLGVTNRSPEPLDRILDCEPDPMHVKRFQWNQAMGSRTRVQVPPMSTRYVMLEHSDKDCSLLEVE